MNLNADIPTAKSSTSKSSVGGAIIAAVAGVCFVAAIVMLTVKLGLVLFT